MCTFYLSNDSNDIGFFLDDMPYSGAPIHRCFEALCSIIRPIHIESTSSRYISIDTCCILLRVEFEDILFILVSRNRAIRYKKVELEIEKLLEVSHVFKRRQNSNLAATSTLPSISLYLLITFFFP